MIMERSTYALSDSAGVLLSFDNLSKEVSLLDFSQAQRLHDLGYAAASAIVDSIRQHVSRVLPPDEIAIRRSLFRAAFPPLVFKDITISGANEHQSRYVAGEIQGEEEQTFTMDDFRRGYFQLLSDNSITEIRPTVHFNPGDETFSLHLDVDVDDYLSLSLGGAITTGNINEIYFGMCYNHVGLRSAQVSLGGQVGRPYNTVGLETRLDIPSRVPVSLVSWATTPHLTTTSRTSSSRVRPNSRSTSSKRPLPSSRSPSRSSRIRRRSSASGQDALSMTIFPATPSTSATSFTTVTNTVCSEVRSTLARTPSTSPQYATKGCDQHFLTQVFTGTDRYLPGEELDAAQANGTPISWLQVGYVRRGYQPLGGAFTLGTHFETFYSSRNLAQNFTASMMQAQAFAPSPA